ncbi:hypothetical protein BT93_K1461 [Corymbia citriodora subsp. variegata]|nr:hypothetical protein BT93_K1461 [Corymbia citriodora subsp. variegata]
MGMAFKMLVRLAVCYLGVSWFLLTAAVPVTRSLKSGIEIKSLPDLQSLSLGGAELIQGGGTNVVKGRMDVEINDYADPGANPRHDPPPSSSTKP